MKTPNSFRQPHEPLRARTRTLNPTGNSLRRQRTESPAGDRGWTRLDLIALLSGMFLLSTAVLPLLIAAPSKTDREQCLDNLRSIGQAFQGWAKEHANRVPWRVLMADGGTYDLPGNGNAWVHLACLSNQIASPKILACPGDGIRAATEWSRKPEGGFLHPNYRGNAVSYFVGLDVQENAPKALLSGDHHLVVSATAQTCDYANVNTASSLMPGDGTVEWTQAGHGSPGNILFYDGAVSSLRSGSLRQALTKTGAVHKENHILMPR